MAEDTGDLKILSIDEDNRIRALSYFKVMELIPQLGTWHQSKRILAASRNSISVWEADDLDKKPIELFEYVLTIDILNAYKFIGNIEMI